jgi:hypothetical protein
MNENYTEKNKEDKDYNKQIETEKKLYTMEVNHESKVDLLEVLELFLCPNITI